MSGPGAEKHGPILSGGDEEYITGTSLAAHTASGITHVDVVVTIDWEHSPSSVSTATAFYQSVVVYPVGSGPQSYVTHYGTATYATGYDYTPAGVAVDAVLRYHFGNLQFGDNGEDLDLVLAGSFAVTGSPGFSASDTFNNNLSPLRLLP